MKKIFFVDDEQKILDGSRLFCDALLHHPVVRYRQDWNFGRHPRHPRTLTPEE